MAGAFRPVSKAHQRRKRVCAFADNGLPKEVKAQWRAFSSLPSSAIGARGAAGTKVPEIQKPATPSSKAYSAANVCARGPITANERRGSRGITAGRSQARLGRSPIPAVTACSRAPDALGVFAFRPDDAGGLNVNPPSPISNEYLEAIRQESSVEWECRHRAMAAQVYPGIMPDDLFPIPSPRVDQPDNQGPEGNTP